MDFSKIDFTHCCYVDLHVGAYGSLSGMFFNGESNLIILERHFKESHDWQPSFKRDGRQYVMGFIDPGNIKFNQFMLNLLSEQNKVSEKFFLENGFYEQEHDFLDIWFDNDVSDVQISFPLFKCN